MLASHKARQSIKYSYLLLSFPSAPIPSPFLLMEIWTELEPGCSLLKQGTPLLFSWWSPGVLVLLPGLSHLHDLSYLISSILLGAKLSLDLLVCISFYSKSYINAVLKQLTLEPGWLGPNVDLLFAKFRAMKSLFKVFRFSSLEENKKIVLSIVLTSPHRRTVKD